MRIRKNAKLCAAAAAGGGGGGSVLFGLDDNFQTHVCQLNQSPWDVIPFGSESPFQFDGEEDSFTGNGSRGDSVGAVESVASMMDAEDQTKPLPKIEDTVFVHDNEAKALDYIDEGRIADETTSFCQKTDGKNWHCKNEAKQGQSFCEHHLSLLRSYNNNNSVSYNNNNTSSSKKAAASAAASAAGPRRGKPRAAAAKRASSSSSSATSNPYEFYYYSGFGPLWGKRRGDRNGEGSNNHGSKNEQVKGIENSTITEAEEANEETTQNTSSSPSRTSSSSQMMMDNEEFDYGVDDDDEEDEDDELAEDHANGDNSGKKRMRKPVKARSLKSLM